MKSITVLAAFLGFTFTLLQRSAAFYPNFRVIYKQPQKQLFLSQFSGDPEIDEVFNENDDFLSGEPTWFESISQPGNPVDQSETVMIDKGVIRRTLPLYLLNDDQCFPTGRLSLRVSNQYCSMMDDITKKDKMFGVVMSDGKGRFCEVGTAVETIKQEYSQGGSQKIENVCRQRFRIVKIVQVEPYLIADVDYGFSDLDVLEAERRVEELPDSVANLEKEIYQILFDVITLTNKIYEEEDAEGYNRGDAVLELSQAVKLLSPLKHMFRLSVASDFSFAVSDMMAASPRLKQLLLESTSLESRLGKIKKALVNARSYLMDRMDAYEEPFN